MAACTNRLQQSWEFKCHSVVRGNGLTTWYGTHVGRTDTAEQAGNVSRNQLLLTELIRKKKISYNVNKMSPTESECFYLASTNQALTHLTTISDSCQLLWAPLLCPASSHPSEMYKTRETKSTQSKSKSRVLNTLSMSPHSSKLRQKTQQQLCRHWQVWRTGPTPSSIFKCICLSLPSGKHICEQFRDSYS